MSRHRQLMMAYNVYGGGGEVMIPDNEIWYTSSDGELITPYSTSNMGLVSNTYENGKGVLLFEKPVTFLPYCFMWKSETLTSVTLPHTLTEIGNGAFCIDTNLYIDELKLDSLKNIGGGAFNSVKIRKIESLGDVTALPENSNNTGEVFGNNPVLESVSQKVLDKLTSYYNAFYNCPSLIIDELRLPSLSIINGNLGFNKSTIRRITDLGKITRLFSNIPYGNTPFGVPETLELVIVPDTVTAVGRYAFNFAMKYSKIKFLSIVPPSLDQFHGFNAFLGDVYVPDESLEAYKAADGWNTNPDKIHPLSEYIDN